MKTSHIMLGALAAGVGYVAYKEYGEYKRRKLLAAGLDPSNPSGARKVFETIGSHSPTTGETVTTVAPSAGLPSCDTMFPVKPDGIEVLRQMLIMGAKSVGKCA